FHHSEDVEPVVRDKTHRRNQLQLENAENYHRTLVQLPEALSKDCNTVKHRAANLLLICLVESVEIISHLLLRKQRRVKSIQIRGVLTGCEDKVCSAS